MYLLPLGSVITVSLFHKFGNLVYCKHPLYSLNVREMQGLFGGRTQDSDSRLAGGQDAQA